MSIAKSCQIILISAKCLCHSPIRNIVLKSEYNQEMKVLMTIILKNLYLYVNNISYLDLNEQWP